jgi:hypothetical protein
MTRIVLSLFVVHLACVGCRSSEPADVAVPVPASSGATPQSGTRVTVQALPGTFVWLEPTFAWKFAPPEGKGYVDQQGQMFTPGEVLVRTGQPIEFRSSDDVLHNVRVIRSDKAPIFNVATPPFGAYTHTFDEPGVYDVTCDIHTAMKATIFVASTPYIATSDETGRFTFEDVVPGKYRVAGFDEGTRVEKLVHVSGAHVDVTLP